MLQLYLFKAAYTHKVNSEAKQPLVNGMMITFFFFFLKKVQRVHISLRFNPALLIYIMEYLPINETCRYQVCMEDFHFFH